MQQQKLTIHGIPAILWGAPSDKVFLHVHGKMSRKEYAESFALLAQQRGWQTLSFDLPEHGERTDSARLDVWNGIRELGILADYAFGGWARVGLFACSLGAYFALNTYADRPFERCLFQSPIVDMQWLVKQMMLWNQVTEERLREEGEIDTPIDPLRWDYYQYILQHPVKRWPIPTAILYAMQDDLQPYDSIRAFTERFNCALTTAASSSHAFMAPGDDRIVSEWMAAALDGCPGKN